LKSQDFLPAAEALFLKTYLLGDRPASQTSR
jgi:hypothetical protein